nr:hypothetical protein [Candidatus Bathyarchaeota archaeon]
MPIGLGETPIKIISASNTSQQVFYNERFIRFTFTLMFNTTNSSLYGTYAVIPAYFNTTSGSVWNVDLMKHFELNRFIVFNLPSFSWFNYSIDENGALDLDNNKDTPNYYVRMHVNATSHTEVTYDFLVVIVGVPPGLLFLSYVGYVHFNQTVDWERNYTWTYTNGTAVSDAEMSQIRDMIWENETMGMEKLGYAGLGPITENTTIDNLTGDPKYWWITDKNFEWTWLVFRVKEVYATDITGLGVTWNTLMSEFAGILLYTDVDGDGVLDMGVSPLLGAADPEEATHVFLIDSAQAVNLTLPFNGAYGENGSVTVSGGETVDFGVTLSNVSGVLFPLKVGNAKRVHNVWSFIREVTPVDPEDFDKTPSKANVTGISLVGHFNLEAGDGNFKGVLKIDQRVGEWSVNVGNSTNPADLTNRSLAIAYYGRRVQGNYTSTFVSESGRPVDPDENSTMSSTFSFKVGNASIADFQMGGSVYVWNGTENYTAYSSTTPVSAFKGMYIGEAGDSIANITITGETYFMATCFPKWNGKSIDNDPSYISYISTSVYETQTPLTLLLLLLLTSSGKGGAGIIIMIVAVAATAGTGAITIIRRKRSK